MECLNPITIKYVKAKTDEIKKTFISKIRDWESKIKQQIDNYDGLKNS